MADRKRTTVTQESPIIPLKPDLAARIKTALEKAYEISLPILNKQEKVEQGLEWCRTHLNHPQYTTTFHKCIELSSIVQRANLLLQWASLWDQIEYTWIDMHAKDSLNTVRVYIDPEYYNPANGKLLWEWIVEEIEELEKKVNSNV